jgi:hypothetical protein
MDIIAHFLWTFVLFHNKAFLGLAIFFGLFPDMLPFVPLLWHWHKTKKWHVFKYLTQGEYDKAIEHYPRYVVTAYNFTHSLVVWLFVFVVCYLLFGKLAYTLLAWLVHIIVDIPTHTKDFFPTKFLFPLSNFHFNGKSWYSRRFQITNYSLIALSVVFAIVK